MSAFRFAASTVLYGRQPLDKACAELAAVGLRQIDIWHVENWCEHLADGVPTVRDTIRRHGLQIETLSVFNWPLARLPALLDQLAELNGRALITASAKPDVTVSRYLQEIDPVIRHAQSLDVTLAIENHGATVIDSIESMLTLVKLQDSPALGIALSPIHLYNRGESAAEAIRALGQRVALCYAWDWGAKGLANWKDPTRQFIGTGNIDHRPIFEALQATGYAHPVQLFAHGPEDWPPDKTTVHLRRALAVARCLADATDPCNESA
ncbi:MAG: TIM barrel protein [Chloroflexota bacterium]|nr:TIM barrel protein [Chloroflexota bacterium]